ncbi:MAG: hypothetical protein E5W43_01035 [Mesorhizobium sp.]|nr:MAG: hypothetical protein E5W43_01035 [Mesorhizobium sp.]
MTDRPILFSGPMVRALLAGRKTQTRRIWTIPKGHKWTDEATGILVYEGNGVEYGINELRCRYAVGDRLWVREAWRTTCNLDSSKPRFLDAGHRSKVTFEADSENRNPLWAFGRLRAGMHMPRWASRLTLTVTEVRVQRLQDISEADALAEGVEEVEPWEGMRRFKVYGDGGEKLACPYGARISYSTLWDSLNAARGFGWEENPWVVAVSFTVAQRNIDAVAA